MTVTPGSGLKLESYVFPTVVHGACCCTHLGHDGPVLKPQKEESGRWGSCLEAPLISLVAAPMQCLDFVQNDICGPGPCCWAWAKSNRNYPRDRVAI